MLDDVVRAAERAGQRAAHPDLVLADRVLVEERVEGDDALHVRRRTGRGAAATYSMTSSLDVARPAPGRGAGAGASPPSSSGTARGSPGACARGRGSERRASRGAVLHGSPAGARGERRARECGRPAGCGRQTRQTRQTREDARKAGKNRRKPSWDRAQVSSGGGTGSAAAARRRRALKSHGKNRSQDSLEPRDREPLCSLQRAHDPVSAPVCRRAARSGLAYARARVGPREVL